MTLKQVAKNHGLTIEGVDYALRQYQIVISEITHGLLSKLSYDAHDVLQCAQERWCDTCELKAQETSDTNAGKWISVKDRLPNCNGLYLVWRPHFFGGEIGEPVVCYFDGQDTWHDSYGVDFERILNTDDVTHWMPLPEPPKEE